MSLKGHNAWCRLLTEINWEYFCVNVTLQINIMNSRMARICLTQEFGHVDIILYLGIFFLANSVIKVQN